MQKRTCRSDCFVILFIFWIQRPKLINVTSLTPPPPPSSVSTPAFPPPHFPYLHLLVLIALGTVGVPCFRNIHHFSSEEYNFIILSPRYKTFMDIRQCVKINKCVITVVSVKLKDWNT